MKYKLYVNQSKMSIFLTIIGSIFMAIHKFSGTGFLGFTLLLITLINSVEIQKE